MPRKKVSLKYILYIPKSIDIDLLIKNSPPDFKYNRDKFVYVLHLLTSINALRKDEDKEYTTIYSLLLKNKIGSDYKKYLIYLIEKGIVDVDDKYSTTSHFSKSYKFTAVHAQSNLMDITITNKVMIKNIKTFTDLSNEKDVKILPPKDKKEYQHLEKHFNDRLTIDFSGAVKFLEDLKEEELFRQAFLFEKYMTN